METGMLGSGALADVAGPFKDFAEKLGSSEGPMWLSAFKRFLRKENPWELKLLRRMSLIIGGVSAAGLSKHLKDGGDEVSQWACDIMSKNTFTTLAEPTMIEIGWITVQDLGFNTEPTTTELFARIKEVGGLCPAEVGPHLKLLADKDQQRGTRYQVAMEPITDSDGNPRVFSVDRDDFGGRWLLAFCTNPQRRWRLDRVIVLVLRK